MKGISKEVLQKLKECFDEFNTDTIEPKSVRKDDIGQFVAIGKLKNPTSHQGSSVNVVTIRTVFLTDNMAIKETRTDLTHDELELYRQCCEDVLKRWNDHKSP